MLTYFKACKILAQAKMGSSNGRKVHRQEHYFITHLRRGNSREKCSFVESLMLSSCYFKTLLFIVNPAWWEFIADQWPPSAQAPPHSQLQNKLLSLTDPRQVRNHDIQGALTIPLSQCPMASYTRAKIQTPKLSARLDSFNMFQSLIPDLNWLIWWLIQQMFIDQWRTTIHKAWY